MEINCSDLMNLMQVMALNLNNLRITLKMSLVHGILQYILEVSRTGTKGSFYKVRGNKLDLTHGLIHTT